MKRIHIDNTLISSVTQCGKRLDGELRHADIDTVKAYLLAAPLCRACLKEIILAGTIKLNPKSQEEALAERRNLLGVDLKEPLPVVFSDKGKSTLPHYKIRSGVATNAIDQCLCRVRRGKNKTWETYYRGFWRLA